ncbi:unnamed protein product, partial [Polarella glacialis]
VRQYPPHPLQRGLVKVAPSWEGRGVWLFDSEDGLAEILSRVFQGSAGPQNHCLVQDFVEGVVVEIRLHLLKAALSSPRLAAGVLMVSGQPRNTWRASPGIRLSSTALQAGTPTSTSRSRAAAAWSRSGGAFCSRIARSFLPTSVSTSSWSLLCPEAMVAQKSG